MQFVVLFGPQAGAHVTLHSGEYVVGSGEDDDVVVMGRGVTDAHFRFEIDDAAGRLTIGACAKPVFAEGARELSENDEIELPQKFWLGDVVVGIGALDTRWEEPKFSQSPHAATAINQSMPSSAHRQEHQETGTGASPSVAVIDGDGPDSQFSDHDAGLDDVPETAQPTDRLSGKRKSSRSAIVIPIVVTTIAVIGGLLTVFLAGDDQSTAMAVDGRTQVAAEQQEKLQEIDGLFAGISDVSDLKVEMVNGVPTVVGFAPSRQTVDMITNAVYGIDPGARIAVIADSDLEQHAKSVLSGRDAGVDTVEDGIVYLKGVVSDPGAKEQLIAFVQEEVVDAAAVDGGKIYEIRELVEQFGDQLKQQGISRISLRSLRDEIIISGHLDWQKLGTWENLLAEWNNEYGLKYRAAQPVILDGDDMPFELVAAVGGDNGFLFLSGQNKVHVGGEVAPGFTLKSVTDGAVVLERNGSEYMIDIRETE
ncbi:FHA domain-containing protein [Thalassospira sp. MA62]|nr:FHA domain-containing protein [Thalassospira sp. MA62]